MAVEREKKSSESASQLVRFQKLVLSWDYVQLLKDSTSRKKVTNLKRVKDTYDNLADYIGTYEPLLFEEVKAQIVRGRDEEETEWQRGAVVTCGEANEFHLVSMGVPPEFGMEISENDLLLLSNEKFQQGMVPITYGFALAEFRENHVDTITLKLRTFLGGGVKLIDVDKIEASPRLSRLLSALKADKSMLWILKITSLSTIMREYIALHSVGTLPFKDLILSAKERIMDDGNSNRAWHVPKPLMEFLVTNHNTSQLEAIHAGLSRKTFVLIQGPPGTGKTQTILGLLSAVLHAVPSRVQSKEGAPNMRRRPELPIPEKYHHWEKSSPWLTGLNPRDLIMPVDGDDGFYPTTGNELKPEIINSNRKYRLHVLVCAPSNSALDEIVLRVLSTGIRDENDHVYNPKIVRIGLKPHHSVQAVSMDYLVEQKLASMDQKTAVAGKSAMPDRDRIRAIILDESAIVFSTLSFSGSSLFTRMNRVFDVVIIDEAAQAVEPATLVPLAHGCKQVYLVGDPVQLPATVISTTAENYGYDVSLFKRFQKAGYPVQMLKTQYRMHPEIRSFPSEEFYSNALDDGPNVGFRTVRPWHDYCCFGPFCFFDVDGVESQPSGSGSWVNVEEVAIISPYRHQVKLFRESFQGKFGVRSDQVVDINTIDGFQGREKDIAIFSCVRANAGKGIGFVSDYRRMNVGITRARSSILVVGSASTLMQDKHWSSLVKNAKDRNCFFKVSKPYSSFFSESNMNSMQIIKQDYDTKIEEIEKNLQVVMNNSVVDTNLISEIDPEANAEDHYDMDVDGGYDED